MLSRHLGLLQLCSCFVIWPDPCAAQWLCTALDLLHCAQRVGRYNKTALRDFFDPSVQTVGLFSEGWSHAVPSPCQVLASLHAKAQHA